MSYYARLKKAFEGAPRLPLNCCTKYVIFSDCHRGTGTSNDNFLKNRTLYLAALQHYYRRDFTCIELGDGDELWENRSMKQIREAHSDVFDLLCCFHKQGRLVQIYGNHDIIKKDWCRGPENCPEFIFHESIILGDLYLTHGHQADFLNSTLWPLACFLVRHIWKPLERYGVLDPTSAAKNYRRKAKTERRLTRFAQKEGHMLIAGHTHRPTLNEKDLTYCNSGSCVHPFSITCLEITRLQISLIKWELRAAPDMTLYVTRKVLVGPVLLR